MATRTITGLRELQGGRHGRTPIVANGVMGMLIFVGAELMIFAGFVSAFTIMRAQAINWPPPGQPRLPFAETAFNTLALLASGATLLWAQRAYRRSPPRARVPLLATLSLGVLFVALQGREWVALLAQGLTLTSSSLGSFFYLIVGAHGLHALAAIGGLGYAWRRLERGWLPPGVFGAASVFWYFVVGVWPLLYWRVYS
jgi:heme/copper-type cytochrome/quinol oxidase subunit 3